LGLGIWFIGLIIEATADIQKYKFKLDKKNKDKFIDIGIWKYSRHPNYFGEILCWVGVYVFVFLSFSISEKLIALIGPLFITTLLLFVSGIPLLEKYADKKWGKEKDYQEYKKNTNILIPWFKKEN
jgi:steroid 5-alpha reductase family enzyme